MTIKFPLEDFFESSGKSTLDFTERLRDGIATFACNLWEQFPAWMTQNANPQTAFLRGFYNSMCSPIQPPVPPPDVSFVGGQCPGVEYDVTVNFFTTNIGTCVITSQGNVVKRVTGPIQGIEFVPNPNVTSTSTCRSGSDEDVVLGDWYVIGQNGQQVGIINGYRWIQNPNQSPLSGATIVTIVRVDGLPDDCGDPPLGYPPNFPTSDDLRTILVIPNFDGLDAEFELVYNQTNNTYNFPTSFKINGVNLTLDLGGITIYGNPQNTQPSDNVGVNQPGFDGGSDGVGGTNDKIYQSDFPTLPDFTSPETIAKTIEYLLCIDGVIETVEQIIKIIPGSNATFEVILQVLVNILKDLCENLDGVEAIVGYPEYYGLRPGADRPSIVYLWKEWDGTNFSKSTFSSTVFHPTQQAIDNIDTIEGFTKFNGSTVVTLKLVDGSAIKASGSDQASANSNFNFLLGQVRPEFIPPDVEQNKIVSVNQNISTRQLRLRQIEYYPVGGGANKSPTKRRIIDPPPAP